MSGDPTELERRLAALEAENAELRTELASKRTVAAKALASFQQRALQMEVIRQQNVELDNLTSELVKANQLVEQRAAEVEQAARLKSEFLANFSHEIRTPLNGILGYCDLLMREEGSRLTPHGRRDLNVVKSNARTLLALINDILDLSKIEAGRVDVAQERVDVGSLIDECVQTVRETLKGKDVSLHFTVAEAARSAMTDSLKLRQVMLNLLSNAAKFTEAGEIVVDAKANGTELVLTVEDTGIGVPPEQLAVIFQKFRQIEGSSTRKYGGTGLGLA
ncbi:MAG: hybrid sensor histidine kinase/response regulator, partial [Proteobacteria bacterium]